LSKRTNLYAFYSYAHNYLMLTGLNANTVGVGVRHLF
jgi:predicted porin